MGSVKTISDGYFEHNGRTDISVCSALLSYKNA